MVARLALVGLIAWVLVAAGSLALITDPSDKSSVQSPSTSTVARGYPHHHKALHGVWSEQEKQRYREWLATQKDATGSRDQE